MTVHVCNLRTHGGKILVRIVAIRRNRRPLLADFDVIVIQKAGDLPARIVAEEAFNDFARALGAEGIFGIVLTRMAESDRPAIDENGVEIPMPELTKGDLIARGKMFAEMAHQAFQMAGVGGPELIDPGSESGLFDPATPAGALATAPEAKAVRRRGRGTR